MAERLEPVPKHGVGLRCTICNHPARPQIDLAIATGLSKRAIAQRFSVRTTRYGGTRKRT